MKPGDGFAVQQCLTVFTGSPDVRASETGAGGEGLASVSRVREALPARPGPLSCNRKKRSSGSDRHRRGVSAPRGGIAEGHTGVSAFARGPGDDGHCSPPSVILTPMCVRRSKVLSNLRCKEFAPPAPLSSPPGVMPEFGYFCSHRGTQGDSSGWDCALVHKHSGAGRTPVAGGGPGHATSHGFYPVPPPRPHCARSPAGAPAPTVLGRRPQG